jgi:PAS domain S-box-containing protein
MMRTSKHEPVMVLVVVALIIELLLAYKIISGIKDQTENDLRSSLETVLNTTHDAVNIWIAEVKKDASDWTESNEFRSLVVNQLKIPRKRESLLKSSFLKELDTLLEAKIKRHDYLGYILISPDYINIASLLKKNIGAENILANHNNYLSRAFNGETIVTLPQKTDIPLMDQDNKPDSNAPTMFSLSPVYDNQNKVIAVIAFRLDPVNNFTPILQLGRIGKSGETYAFDSDGRLISESRFDDQLRAMGLIKKGQRGILSIEIRDPGLNLKANKKPGVNFKNKPLTLMAKKAIEEKSRGNHTLGYRDYRGINVVGAWLWDKNLGFGMVTEMDEEEAFHTFNEGKKLSIAILSFSIIVTFILFVLINNRRKEILASEERFKRSTLGSTDIFWEWDIDKDVFWWSPRFYETLGFVDKRICSNTEKFKKLLHPDDVKKVYRLMCDHFNPDEPYDIEYRLKHYSGRYLWFHARGETLYDEKKKPVKLSGSIRDITEMKEAYSEIRKLTLAVEQSPLSIVITNVDGNIEYVNSEFTNVTGYEPEEVIGKTPRILKSGTHTQSFYKDQWETILSGKVWKGIILNKSKDGVLFWESTSIAPIRDEQNEISHFVAVKENITERKEIEDRLIELSQSVEQSLSSIMITDINGIIKYVNPAFVEITGYEFDEAIGKPPSILKSGKHSKSFYKEIWDTLLDGKSWEGEICNRNKNGTLYWEYECISPIKNSEGEINSYLSVRLDTTQRKRDEEKLTIYAEELQRSNESLGHFASIASHDLQEPLRKIITFGDRLKEVATNLDPTSYEYINRMQKSSFRMKELIEDILSYSKVDSSPKQPRKINLGQIIDESLVNLEGRIEETKGVVEVGDISIIEADPVQMMLLFQNIIGNSLKYHRIGIPPLVSISSEPIEGDRLKIIIKDNGIGMDIKFTDKIFLPFQRLHGRSEYEGTGMGLAICKKIIDGHHGSISVESKLEEGSAFVITLPKKQP